MLVFALVAMPLSAVAQRYSASYHAEPVEQVVQDLQQRTGYDFVYQKQVLSGLPDVTCQCSDLSLGALLHCVLLDHCGLAYEISGKTIVLKRPPATTPRSSARRRSAERWSTPTASRCSGPR